MILKPLELVKTIFSTKLFNKHLKRRIYEVALFLLNKSPNSNIIENLMIAFGKAVLAKIQDVISGIKTEFEVFGVIRVYY